MARGKLERAKEVANTAKMDGKKEVASQMKKDGESKDKIKKYTGLTDDEIDKL